jgi:hypothetical protein
MKLWLPPDVHAVVIADDLVLLDAPADAYLCLAGCAKVLEIDPGGQARVHDQDLAQGLLDEGLLTRDPAPPRRPPPAKASLDLPLETASPTRAQALAMARACLASAAQTPRLTFAELLEKARARRARLAARNPDLEAVVLAARAFARMRPWAPNDGACLQRSYLMLAYLHFLGLDADWMIGVRTWPFMAHCWLQAGGVSLEEDAERLVAYSPILVV